MALLQARVALLEAGMLGGQRRHVLPDLGSVLSQSLLGAAQLLGHGLQLLHLLRLAAVGLPLSLQGSLDILHETKRTMSLGQQGPTVAIFAVGLLLGLQASLNLLHEKWLEW